MMMISNSRRRPHYHLFAAIAALLLLVGAATLWRAPLQDTLTRILEPLLHARFGNGNPSAASADPSRLAAAEADRDALYQENIDLKMRLGRGTAAPRVLAGVLLRPPATPYDTLTIDAGSGDGIAVGDFVAAGGTVLVGYVSQVFAGSARVTLYSAPGERYDALLSLRSGAKLPVTVTGQGGGSLSAQVPAGSSVSVGDALLLPGVLGGLVAHVAGVQASGAESFVTIYLTLPVNPAALRFVEVWKK